MTLHPELCIELLDMEVEAAKTRSSHRFSSIERVGTDILCKINATSLDPIIIRFAGENYDAEPFKVAVVRHDGSVAPVEEWPGTLCGGMHPLLGYPFTCIRGCFEYHVHPSHLDDRWDIYRNDLRLPQLLSHILRRVGK